MKILFHLRLFLKYLALYRNKQYKIAYLLGSLNRGGTETLLLDIFNNTSTETFEKIAVYRHDGDISNDFFLSNTKVIKLTPGSLPEIWLYVLRLRKLLKKENVNIVHTHQRIDTIYAWFAGFGIPLKIIQTLHDFDFQSGILSRFLIRISLELADRNVFVSNYQKQYYTSAYNIKNKYKSYVVYNGVSFDKFKHPNKNTLRRELNLSDQCLLLGMVGNFVQGHDQMTICRFLILLLSQNVDFKFLFIGKKDDRKPELFNNCFRYCRNNGLGYKISFLGSRTDVPEILPQLDAFIYSSDHDTFGISVIEAIASGIPVFVNDWEVMKEITENGKRAILYKSKDENDLLSKFLEFYSEPEYFQEKANENSSWVMDRYNIRNHINNLYRTYCTV